MRISAMPCHAMPLLVLSLRSTITHSPGPVEVRERLRSPMIHRRLFIEQHGLKLRHAPLSSGM